MSWIDYIFDQELLLSLQSLDIQRRSLDLAQGSFFLSTVISIISILGIAAALWTATLTRRSVKSANEALKLSHSIGRAWISHSDYQSGPITKSIINGEAVTNGIIIRISYKNCGQTPALQVRARLQYEIIPTTRNDYRNYFDDTRECGKMMLAPGEERHFDVHLNDHETRLIRGQQHKILVEVSIEYNTVAESLGLRRTKLSYLGTHNSGTIATGGQQSGDMTVISGPLGDFAD